MNLVSSKKILIAPLNWGFGHATRCVPIINALIEQGFEPIIASDGNALNYLKNEFPTLKSYTLPAYDIMYAKYGYFLKLKLFSQTPKIIKAIRQERKMVAEIIEKEKIKGLISDNRFGVYSRDIPTVYITHQVQVLSGLTTFLTSKLHQKQLFKYNEVWIPDVKKTPRLSGKLTTFNESTINTKFIGVLSRFKREEKAIQNYKYDVLVLLSGIELQRNILEKKLVIELDKTDKKILFVRGLLNPTTKLKNTQTMKFVDFLNQTELIKALNESELVIARSGYSTIMDLAVLQKKAFFIPTPGQTEQEYLAQHLNDLKISPFAKQSNFKIELLDKITNYSGFETKYQFNSENLFEVFE